MRPSLVLGVAVFLSSACATTLSAPAKSAGHSDGECDVFERACPRTETCASIDLAACLEAGWRDHPPDKAAALQIHGRHCQTGHLSECQLAARLSDELGDRDGAIAFLERACSLSPLECEGLGRAYEAPPSGVAPDYEKARTAYRRGCTPPGIAAACDALEELDKRAPTETR